MDWRRPARAVDAGQPGCRRGPQRRAVRRQPAKHLGAQEPAGGAAGGHLHTRPQPGSAAGPGRRGQGLIRADRVSRARGRRPARPEGRIRDRLQDRGEARAAARWRHLQAGDDDQAALHGGDGAQARDRQPAQSTRGSVRADHAPRHAAGRPVPRQLPGGPRVQQRPPQPRHRAGDAGSSGHRQRSIVQGPRRGHPVSPRSAGERGRRARPLHGRPLAAGDAVRADDRAPDEVLTEGPGRVGPPRARCAAARHRQDRRAGCGAAEAWEADGRGVRQDEGAHDRRLQHP